MWRCQRAASPITGAGAEQGERDERAWPRLAAREALLDGGALGVRGFALILAGGDLHAEARPREVRLVLGMTGVMATRHREVAHRAMRVALAERLLAAHERVGGELRGARIDRPHGLELRQVRAHPVGVAAALGIVDERRARLLDELPARLDECGELREVVAREHLRRVACADEPVRVLDIVVLGERRDLEDVVVSRPLEPLVRARRFVRISASARRCGVAASRTSGVRSSAPSDASAQISRAFCAGSSVPRLTSVCTVIVPSVCATVSSSGTVSTRSSRSWSSVVVPVT